MTRRHVWRRVSASQSRAADLDRTLEFEAELALHESDEESKDHWLKASQTNTATAKTSQSASQTLLLSAVGSDEEFNRSDEVNLNEKRWARISEKKRGSEINLKETHGIDSSA